MLTKVKNIVSSSVFVVLLIIVIVIALLIGLDIFQARHYVTLFIDWLKKKLGIDKLKGGLFTGVKMNYTEQDAKDAILALKKKYPTPLFGIDIAKTVEQMYRLETAHFKSSQFRLTGTAGMEQGAWGKVLNLQLPTVKLKDPVLGMRDYLVWNPKDFANFLAEYIIRYHGNFARWNTLKADKQLVYAAKVKSVKSKFV